MKKIDLELLGVRELGTSEMKTAEGGVAIIGSAAGLMLGVAAAYAIPVIIAGAAITGIGFGIYHLTKG